jgi:hypothetical protein
MTNRLASALFILLTLALTGRPALTAGDDAIVDRPEALLFRIVLKDGGSLASYGEFARVNNQVVFSLPTSSSLENPQLQLVNIPADLVDWGQTERYTDSTRARWYLATRAEQDYSALTDELAQALNDVALRNDAAARLPIVERARKTLAEWPQNHYGYKQDEIRQMVAMLDAALAELRAARGTASFDLAFVAGVSAPMWLMPIWPAATPKETIEEMLTAARLTSSPVERLSLLTVASGALDRDALLLPADWKSQMRESILAAIAQHVQIDRAYQVLGSRILKVAIARAETADVHGISSLLAQIRVRDAALGSVRPDVVNSLVAEVEAQLDAARRLSLARDTWSYRLPAVRRYLASVDGAIRSFSKLREPLQDIKLLASSPPSTLTAVRRTAEDILNVVATIVPPPECRPIHELLLSAAQLADSAVLIRRDAMRTSDMTRAWNASSAAAGSLMLAARAESEMQALLRPPQLPR